MAELKTLRKKINDVDERIIKLLSERQKVVEDIGKLKAKTGVEVIDAQREQELADLYDHLSATYSLEPHFVKQVFKMIILESRRLQQ